MSTKSPAAKSPAGARSPNAENNKSPAAATRSPIRKSQIKESQQQQQNSKRSLSNQPDNNSQNTEVTGANPNQSPGQPNQANQPPKALEVKKPPRDKKKRKPEGGALSQDFESFDILWFDLTTKTRQLVEELSEPLVDKVYEHKDLLNRIMKQLDENYSKVDALEAIVYDRDKKLDVFEQIYGKIEQVETDRKVIEQRLEANDKMIMQTFDDFKFKMDNHDRLLTQMVKNTEQALDDLSDLKDTIRSQNDAMSASIKEVSETMVNDSTELRKKMGELWQFMSMLKQKSQDQQGGIDGLLLRMQMIEDKATMLDDARVKLELGKNDNDIFLKFQEHVEEELRSQFYMAAETRDNCTRLAHYQEKYQPVRVQAMIGDTLYACLTGTARRSHELYDSEKLYLLYRDILNDDGKGQGIQQIIIQLNELSRHRVDEAEKGKRNLAEESYIKSQITMGQNQTNAAPANTKSIKQEEVEQEASNTNQMDSNDSEDVQLPIDRPQKQVTAIKKNSAKNQPKANSVELNTLQLNNLANLNLSDLLKPGFNIETSDQDFKLSHDQLIRCCKWLLHKCHCQDLKNENEREFQNQNINMMFEKMEKSTRSQMEEVAQLVHSVHQDFENFLRKHKKEHAELNLKLTKLSEVGHRTLDSIDEVRDSVEKQATIFPCLLEFIYIEQALSNTDNSLLKANQIDTFIKIQQKTKHSKGSLGGSVNIAENAAKTANNFFPSGGQYADDSLDHSINGLNQKKTSKDINAFTIDSASTGAMSVQRENKVNYRQKLILRSHLQDIRLTLLEKCEEVIENTTWPFATHNLTTSKIFNDLIQFHGTQLQNTTLGSLNQNSRDGDPSKDEMLSTDRKGKRNSPWPTGGLGTPSELRYPTGPGRQFHTNTHRGKNGPNFINFNQAKRNSGLNNSAILSSGTWKASQVMHLNLHNLSPTEMANPIRTSQGNANWKNGALGGTNYGATLKKKTLNQDLNPASISIDGHRHLSIDPNVKFPNI